MILEPVETKSVGWLIDWMAVMEEQEASVRTIAKGEKGEAAKGRLHTNWNIHIPKIGSEAGIDIAVPSSIGTV